MKIFRNRTVIGVLCILLALIICFGVTPLFSRSASEKTEIVRVTMDIKEGDEITAEMVQTVEVGAYNLPQNLMTDKKEVVGKYATADLAAGDYILSSKLSAVPAAENAYLYNLDGTKQAISVTIKSFAVGLSGKLESGDIVTVIVADYQGKGETAIPPELQYVEVISVTASSGYDANTGEVVDEKELPSTVTLLVTTEQAKVLAELEQDTAPQRLFCRTSTRWMRNTQKRSKRWNSSGRRDIPLRHISLVSSIGMISPPCVTMQRQNSGLGARQKPVMISRSTPSGSCSSRKNDGMKRWNGLTRPQTVAVNLHSIVSERFISPVSLYRRMWKRLLRT